MIHYEFREDGIFVVTFSEKVTVSEIEKYLIEFETIQNLPKDLLTLYDLRNAAIEGGADDLEKLLQLTAKVTKANNSIRTAFIADVTDIKAFTILFSENNLASKTQREVFSTEDAAIKWLKQL